MRVLLDTQAWLWMLAAPERLAPATRKLLTRSDNELLLSAASAWEIGIKHGLGKLRLPDAPERAVPELMARTGVVPLPVLHRHALRVATLPPKHRDPFDRLLVAQAQIEDLPILTPDRSLRLYDVKVIDA
ncbi:MAG TPA: type II toxin-antitoxin system VapC family toxin [Gemmatimonadales bacterium]|nr:type II toxin-antitoxin system VapC family toxin [Gemmatimonadales bacterium]